MAKRMRPRGKRGIYFTAFRDSKSGKLIEVSLGTTDKVLAERELGKLLGRIEDGGGDPTLISRPFSFMAEKFKKEILPTFAATTQRSCLSRVDTNLIPFFGEFRVCDIEDGRVYEYKARREERGINGLSITVELSNLKSIINLARPYWKLPSRKNQRMRFVNKTDPIVQYFRTEEEFQFILGQCPEWLKPMVIVARNTGLRQANLIWMKWDWVNIFRRTITIPKSRTKNRKGQTVEMNATVHKVFLSRRVDGELVFSPPEEFRHLKPDSWCNKVYGAFKDACIEGGRPEFRWHGLRHDFCSQLVQRGVPLYEVCKLAGHSSIKQTERYAHLAPANLSDAIKALDRPINVGTVLAEKIERSVK